MKKFISFVLSISILSAMVLLGGCVDNDITTTESATQATEEKVNTSQYKNSKEELNAYFEKFVQGDSPIYGTWQLVDFEYVSFIFRNDNLAEMAMGSEGNFVQLALDGNQKTLSVSFPFGIDGSYTYELSSDNNVLTLTQNNEQLVLNKTADYNFVPKSPRKVKVDNDILGWWKGENGLIYFFGDDGIMYSNQISMETCYTYKAKNGKIDAVYDVGGDISVDLEYSYNNGKLIIEGNKYTSFNPFE